MIHAVGLEKRFGALEVLRGLDLRIEPGRVTAIVGPNAAGKTTFIKIALGLVRPDAGSITFDGAPVIDNHASRERIGYMPQIARFPENLTGRELLDLLTGLRGPGHARDEDLIEHFRLAPQLSKKLGTLSGGTRQKINAVAAFLFRPPLLILDEPTVGLDPLAASALKDKVLAERRAGRTFVLTTHIMSEIEELADDMAFLVEGQLRYAGPVDGIKKLTRQSTLERAVAELLARGLAA